MEPSSCSQHHLGRKSASKSSNFTAACFSSFPTENRRCSHCVATCGTLRNQVVVAWSQTLDSLAPLAVARWVTLLATPWTSLANTQRPASFLTRIQTTTYNRIDNHRQVRQRTVVKPTRCSSSGCSQLPVTCCYRTIQVVYIKFPMRRLI